MAVAPMPQATYAGVYLVGSSTSASKTCQIQIEEPDDVGGNPLFFFQPFYNGSSTYSFATRLISWSITNGIITVNVQVTRVPPNGGWTYDLELLTMILYPTFEGGLPLSQQ